MSGLHHELSEAQRIADCVREAAAAISDERALTFREIFTNNTSLRLASGIWLLDLENIKRALAASDDPEVIAATIEHLNRA